MNILIAYASKYGCTEKCAKLIAEKLNGNIKIINLKKDNIDVLSFDKVIIGGSIYIGQIQKEVKEFCERNLDALKGKKLGLFICGMQEGETLINELNANYPKELLDVAAFKDCIGGEFIFEKMKFLDKAIAQKVANTKTSSSKISEEKINNLVSALS